MNARILVASLVLVPILWPAAEVQARKKKIRKPKPSVIKIVSKNAIIQAVQKLAKDERVPVASSTLVEKGRGDSYYSVEKMLDDDPETFWAEGAKGWGYNQWVALHLPDGTTHLEISPGAGKEQFQNFNRPRQIYLDIYLVKLKREEDGYTPTFQWLGRNTYRFKDEPRPVRQKLAVKLPELVMPERTLYVGVMIIRAVYKGQFDDTSISSLKAAKIWGEP